MHLYIYIVRNSHKQIIKTFLNVDAWSLNVAAIYKSVSIRKNIHIQDKTFLCVLSLPSPSATRSVREEPPRDDARYFCKQRTARYVFRRPKWCVKIIEPSLYKQSTSAAPTLSRDVIIIPATATGLACCTTFADLVLSSFFFLTDFPRQQIAFDKSYYGRRKGGVPEEHHINPPGTLKTVFIYM